MVSTHITFGLKKYLWGNMPPIDVLRLSENEGAAYAEELKLLFAGIKIKHIASRRRPLTSRIASGDLRNVVKTVASLSQSYTKDLSIVINDSDFDVVARNIIMLFLALAVPNEQEAAESVLHLWYSALIRPIDMQHLESLRPLIEDVCTKIAGCNSGTLQAKTFTFGSWTLRVVLKKEAWIELLESLSVRKGLSTEQAHEIRVAVTKAPHRLDYRHRDLMFQLPEHRICKERFREDGILVPFSYSRGSFTIPNP